MTAYILVLFKLTINYFLFNVLKIFNAMNVTLYDQAVIHSNAFRPFKRYKTQKTTHKRRAVSEAALCEH